MSLVDLMVLGQHRSINMVVSSTMIQMRNTTIIVWSNQLVEDGRQRLVREDPCKKSLCSNGILPDSVSTPPPSSKRTLCGRYFSPKMGRLSKTAILTLEMDILTITVAKHDS